MLAESPDTFVSSLSHHWTNRNRTEIRQGQGTDSAVRRRPTYTSSWIIIYLYKCYIWNIYQSNKHFLVFRSRQNLKNHHFRHFSSSKFLNFLHFESKFSPLNVKNVIIELIILHKSTLKQSHVHLKAAKIFKKWERTLILE